MSNFSLYNIAILLGLVRFAFELRPNWKESKAFPIFRIKSFFFPIVQQLTMVYVASTPRFHRLGRPESNGKKWHKTNDANSWIWLIHPDTTRRNTMDFCGRNLVLCRRLAPKWAVYHELASENDSAKMWSRFEYIWFTRSTVYISDD